jgi:hypothetical protein
MDFLNRKVNLFCHKSRRGKPELGQNMKTRDLMYHIVVVVVVVVVVIVVVTL